MKIETLAKAQKLLDSAAEMEHKIKKFDVLEEEVRLGGVCAIDLSPVSSEVRKAIFNLIKGDFQRQVSRIRREFEEL